MKNLNYIKNTFVRQLDLNDCGIACLRCILSYAGQDAGKLLDQQQVIIPLETGTSLLGLKRLANDYGLIASCVRMDMLNLKALTQPCILHVLPHHGCAHFMVCYRREKKGASCRFLVGDPAVGVYYLNENELIKIWISHGALCFNTLPKGKLITSKSILLYLFSQKIIPEALWLGIPLLSISTGLLGLAVSWVLQKVMDSSLAVSNTDFIVSILILLFMVTLFKCLLGYVRQRILINLNALINEILTNNLFRKLLCGSKQCNQNTSNKTVASGMADMQKIQNAISIFASVILSDGLIVLAVLSSLFYNQPVIATIDLLYIILIVLFTFKYASEFPLYYTQLQEMAGNTEDGIIKGGQNPSLYETPESQLASLKIHQSNHNRYLRMAKFIAVKMSTINLVFECSGAATVVVAISYGLFKLQGEVITYGPVMIMVILSYFIILLMPKICNAIYIIVEGLDVYRGNKYFMDKN